MATKTEEWREKLEEDKKVYSGTFYNFVLGSSWERIILYLCITTIIITAILVFGR